MWRCLPVGLIAVLATGVPSQSQSPPSSQKEPKPLCSVAGRVVGSADGKPLKSARVVLNSEDPETKPSIFAVSTDPDGRFVIKDVPPGQYVFFAMRDGFLTERFHPQNSQDDVPLSLKPGQAFTDILFRMRTPGVITGKVINDDGEPMDRILVRALRKPNEDEVEEGRSEKLVLVPAGGARTDDRGQYRIYGLKPGEYYVEAMQSFEPDRDDMGSGRNFWIDQFIGNDYVPLYYPGVTQASQAETVSAKAGSEVEVDFSMQRVKTVEVAGRVLGPEGPVQSAWVRLEQSGPSYDDADRQTNSDEKGAFRFKGVPPGDYTVSAYLRGDNHIYDEQGRQKVEVGSNNLESIIITLGDSLRVEGHVALEGGGSSPLDRFRVSLFSVEPDGRFGGSAEVNKDGSFELTSVAKGAYGVGVWNLAHEWYVKFARAGSTDVLEKGLQLGSSSDEQIEITLSSGCAQLDGSVTDGDKPIPGARVSIIRDPENRYLRYWRSPAVTDQNGRFSITGIPPGTYRLTARFEPVPDADPVKSDPQFLTFSERDHKTIELKIAKPQTE